MSFPVPDIQALEALQLLIQFTLCAPFVLIALLGLLWWSRPRRTK